jgi:hypothetical protein
MSMNCMKCGREMSDEGVFCGECLAEMENYPVRPGTLIQLPRRKQEPAVKKTRHRRKPQPSPEEQVKVLRRALWRLCAVLLVVLALLGVTGYITVNHLLEDEDFLPGQNYSSVTDLFATEGT